MNKYLHHVFIYVSVSEDYKEQLEKLFHTLLWRSRALAIHINWRSPTEKFDPFSETMFSSFSGRRLIWFEKK